jgi:two-component system chemotaxis sensor kinase CheA
MIDKTLLGEYLSEAEQLFEFLLADLDLLYDRAPESSKGNGPPAAEAVASLINRIFRSVHSLKGLSGMMDLLRVQSLVHDFETILDDLRLGRLALDKEVARALQSAGAGLEAVLTAAARGSMQDEDYQSVRELLMAIDNRPRSKRSDAGAARLLRLSNQDRNLLNPYEEHRIIENIRRGRGFYEVCVEFSVAGLDSRYRALTSKLGEMGEIIATLPRPAGVKAAVGFRIIFASGIKEAEVQEIVEQYSGEVSRIGPSSWRRASEALKSVGRKKKAAERRSLSSPPVSAADLLPQLLDSQPAANSEIDKADQDLDPDMGWGVQDLGSRYRVLPSIAQDGLQPLPPSVHVDLSHIDELSGLAHELSIETERLSAMANSVLSQTMSSARQRFDLKQSMRRIERQFLEFEERLVELRMVSLTQTFTRASRLAARLARDLGKSVDVEVVGRSTQIDKMIADRIAAPIFHVLRNALDHGIEPETERLAAGKRQSGVIRLEARLEGARAIIAISDDGRGIEEEQVLERARQIGAIEPDEQLARGDVLRLIFRPGFSTASEVSQVSGRGVGLDAVEQAMFELGGEIRVSSEKGKGTRFELAVPVTLVMIPAFIVRSGDWRYAINVGQIVELLFVGPDQISGSDGKRKIDWRDLKIPLVELKYLLGLGGARRLPSVTLTPGNRGSAARQAESATASNGAGRPKSASDQRVPAFITRIGDRHVAIAVESFNDQREIIVKSLGPLAQKMKGLVGAVDLEGGDVALVLDLPSLLMLRSVRL